MKMKGELRKLKRELKFSMCCYYNMHIPLESMHLNVDLCYFLPIELCVSSTSSFTLLDLPDSPIQSITSII